jgi:hypothetical protein
MRGRPLSRYLARRTPWWQFVVVGLLSAPVVVARAATARSPFDVLPFVRVVALGLAAAAVVAVDDPASAVTTSTGVGRLRLRLCACAVSGVVLVGVWSVLLASAHRTAATPQRLPAGGLLVELLAMSGVGWSIAACMAELSGNRFVAARAAGVFVVSVAMTLMTPQMNHWFWVGPGTEWHRAHVRWGAVGFVAMVLFLWLSLDPAQRRPLGVHHQRASSAT